MKNEINGLNSSLDFLKEEHAPLNDHCFNASYTLAEKVVKMDCVTCLTLKLENENFNGQLTHFTSISTTSFTSSIEIGIHFYKNPYFARRDRECISSKVTCHYYGDKGHIRPICHIRNAKVPNGTMTWIPKYSLTNPSGLTSLVPKLPI